MSHDGRLSTIVPVTAFVLAWFWPCVTGGAPRSAPPWAPPADPTLDAVLPAALARAYQQLGSEPSGYPMFTEEDGTWVTTGPSTWTSGFFPGSLWYALELSGETAWRTRAEAWTAGLADQQYNTDTHDVGFMIGRSYINGHRLTGRADYRNVLLNAAGSVAQRYNPTVGCIRALGDKDATTGEFLVGLDTMANLDLLLYAARHGGSPAWRNMVISHALRTAQELIRPDGSTIHTVYFDTATGQVLRKGTYQGYSDDSTWTRGHAWVVYGYAMVYRETGDPRFLAIAQQLADYYLSRVPPGWIPPWDFDDPRPNPPPDSSSTAITAAGFFELSRLAAGDADRQRYWNAGCDSLAALCSPACLSDGTNSDAILLHATYNLPTNTGIDCSVAWGDHYFLHAIRQYYWLSTPTTGCHTGTPDWRNIPFALQRGRFLAQFDATPGAANIDAVIGCSAGPGTAFANCPITLRFNPAGYIDARNGSGYQADALLAYQAGRSCHFLLDIDIPAHRYSVYVTPEGAAGVALATNYAFRTEQAGAMYIDNWTLIADPGSCQLCNLRLTGDLDDDGRVNVFDIFVLAEHWNTQAGDPDYDATADIDGDGAINVYDIFLLAENWNL